MKVPPKNIAEADMVREKMKDYWERYKPSLESMMLSNDAQYLAQTEQKEILHYLPSLKGKVMLELGAGIGFVPFFSKFYEKKLTFLLFLKYIFPWFFFYVGLLITKRFIIRK